MRVIIEGDPIVWGKRFTELVCEQWYGLDRRTVPQKAREDAPEDEGHQGRGNAS